MGATTPAPSATGAPPASGILRPTPEPGGYEEPIRRQALQLSLEGTSLRAIGRLLGLHHQTVANWVHQAAAALPLSVTDPTPTSTIEADELSTSVECTRTRSTSSSPSRGQPD